MLQAEDLPIQTETNVGQAAALARSLSRREPALTWSPYHSHRS